MKLAIIALVAAAAAGTAQAQTITQWNFNGSAAGTTAPSVGTGTISTVGGVTASFASGEASGGSSDPASPSPPDFGWGLTNWPAASANNETAGLQVLASTVGYTDIQVSWDQRHSNTASRFWAFFYTIDGVNFTRLSVSAANANPGQTPAAGNPSSTAGLFGGNGTFSAFDGSQTGAGDDWFNGRSVNLTGVAGVANNPNFGFRIVSSFGSGTSYVASSGGNYGTAGTARFDMVTISGVIPTPGSAALMAIGGLVAARRRRA
jgi:hypothetical protein